MARQHATYTATISQRHSIQRVRIMSTLVLISTLVMMVFAGSPGPARAASSLKVQYKAFNTAATYSEIAPWFQIVNTGGSSVNLSTIKLRYWYSADATNPAQVFNCDWAQVGCATITSGFTFANQGAGADYYLELGF